MENLRERAHPLRDLLAQECFDVDMVEEARSMLRWLADGLVPEPGSAPDLLICNARMLGEAGLGLLARWCEANPRVPVLFLSAFSSPKLRARLAQLPGCLLLEQSFRLEDVRSVALSRLDASVA